MIAFSISYFSVQNLTGIFAIVGSLLIFTGIYGSLFLWREISPDVKQLFQSLKQRVIKNK
jgi:hypothetical protein